MPSAVIYCTMPKYRSLNWLTDPGRHVPDEVRLRLMSAFFTSTMPLLVGVACNTMILLVAAIRHPSAPFVALLIADIALFIARLTILVRTRRSAWRGQLLAPDLFITCSIGWTALVGLGTGLCMASGDCVLQFLAPTTMMGIIAGLVTRNNCAPRLALLQVALCDVPLQLAIPFGGQPWMMISIAQCPLMLAVMTKTIVGISEAYLTVVMAKRDSEMQATHDVLTGLWNRAGLMRSLTGSLKNTAAGAASFALLYIDLDGFKVINDRLGHAAGDDLLRQAAARISEAVPAGALVARLGGDEFIVVAPGQDGCGASVIGDAVIAAVSRPYELGAHSVPRIGASIGIACSDRTTSPDELLAVADAALYRAKSKGKGRCFIAEPRDGGSSTLPQRAA